MTIICLAAVTLFPLHPGSEILPAMLPCLTVGDTITYGKMVEILKVQAVRSKEDPKRVSLEITFNLIPDLPKGIEVEFELQRQGLKVGESLLYRLDNDNRKNIKITFNSKERLTRDKYTFMTRISPDKQTPEVRKALEAKPQRFPPDQVPWPYAHVDQAVAVGTDEDEARESAEVKAYFEGQVEKILDLNEEGVNELEKLKTGKTADEAFKKFLTGWMGRMATVQKDVADYLVREPGLYFKNMKLHAEVQELGRMVAKRVSKAELADYLKKKGSTFKLPPVDGFDDRYRFTAGAKQIEDRYTKIGKILNPDAPAEEEAQAGDDSSKNGGGSEKDAGKDAEKKDDSDKVKSDTPAPEEKKPADPKNSKNTKGSGKKDKKKT